MDGSQQRGRSPSGGQHTHHISNSASPHRYGIQNTSVDPSFSQTSSTSQQSNDFGQHQSPGGPDYDISTPWLAQSQQFDPNHSGFLQNPTFSTAEQDHYSSNHQSPRSPFNQQQTVQQQDFFNPSNSGNLGDDFTLFQTPSSNSADAFDPAFLMDPSLQTSQPQSQSVNPADLLNTSSPHQNQNPHTPPSLLQPEDIQSPGQPSPTSLNLQQPHHSPHHSRHTSLDPFSAAFPPGQSTADWSGVNFQTHRRVPSDHSDVSSAAPSPYLGTAESFDTGEHHPSPSLGAEKDTGIDASALGIGRFTLSDTQLQQHRMSPGHIPHVSPQVSPNQEPGDIQVNPFLMTADMNSQQFTNFPETNFYAAHQQESFPTINHDGLTDSNPQNQMAPPEINIEFALPSRQSSFGPPKPDEDDGALFPPHRGGRGRSRAKSDPYTSTSAVSRPLSIGSISYHSTLGEPRTSLSPGLAVPRSSRSASPSSSKSSRRSSTSAIPNRDYILDLADPSRPGSSATDSRRIQKHPATFQCTLCPKRFTRAYNLRSHLRTHTDERPFVCTVCGKAFARQHDRKRHEGLHSGEKKFVCKGELKTGGTWGCGRRFARADALGRHFRSEAGRICIKPLLDEEAQERQRTWQAQQMLAQSQGMQVPPPMAPMDIGVLGSDGGFTLPAALLAKYPDLEGLQWDTLPQGDPNEGDISGRSSFDASSGGEFHDEDDQGGYVSGPGTGYPSGQNAGWNGNEWASDYEGGR